MILINSSLKNNNSSETEVKIVITNVIICKKFFIEYNYFFIISYYRDFMLVNYLKVFHII